jgi:hypothetical protein
MDVRDAVAEMAARAQEISLEAGSKMTGALRDVIHAAAGLSSFAVESARDLVNYMVRRGQMTQEDADKLIREAEEAAGKKKPIAPPPVAKEKPAAAPKLAAAPKAVSAPKPVVAKAPAKPAAKTAAPKKPAPKKK